MRVTLLWKSKRDQFSWVAANTSVGEGKEITRGCC